MHVHMFPTLWGISLNSPGPPASQWGPTVKHWQLPHMAHLAPRKHCNYHKIRETRENSPRALLEPAVKPQNAQKGCSKPPGEPLGARKGCSKPAAKPLGASKTLRKLEKARENSRKLEKTQEDPRKLEETRETPRTPQET